MDLYTLMMTMIQSLAPHSLQMDQVQEECHSKLLLDMITQPDMLMNCHLKRMIVLV